MSHELNDRITTKSINEVELDAATNATFDNWTSGARNFYKNARKLAEDIDDHTTLLMTDIFGSEVAHKHSAKLEQEAAREANAGHLDAANHFKRRDLNISRSVFGENDAYTRNLALELRSPQELRDDLQRVEKMFSRQPSKMVNDMVETKLELRHF